MVKIALFISGRLLGYNIGLLPLINNLKLKYDVKLFASINAFGFGKHENKEAILTNFKHYFCDVLADIQTEEYKMPREYVDNRLKNNIHSFSYNQLSCFYNDAKNFQLIENYENENNCEFDIICKVRSEIMIHGNTIDFIVDNKNDLIIRNKHMMNLRYWGHAYHSTPLMISDAFAYGNKNSMKKYCSTYNFILENDLRLKGLYTHAFEIYLTDSILQHVFYNVPGGGVTPLLTANEIIDKYANNPNNIKIIYIDNVNYCLIHDHIRRVNNFIVNETNVLNYTQS